MLDAWKVAAYRRWPTLGNFVGRAASPRYTAGVLVVLVRADGAVLLVDNSYRTDWFLPGGRLKRHECVEVAARREVQEELQFELPEHLEVCGAAQNPRRHWVTWVIRAEVSSAADTTLTPVGPEVCRAAWFPVDFLPSTTPGVIEHLAMAKVL
jgi:ADP-ribose pyrophosphatase YjhB (NUDIX family)